MEIVIGLVTVVLGVAIPVWLHRLAHPRRALRFRIDAQPAPDRGDARHAVYLTVWSVARADIPSSSFDAGRPLVFDLGTGIRPDSFFSDDSTNLPRGAKLRRLSSTQIGLAPTLLSRQTQVSARMYTDARPTLFVDNPLIDVDIIEDTKRRDTEDTIRATRRRSRVTATQITLGVFIASVVVMSVGIGLDIADSPVGVALGAPAMVIGAFSLIVLIALMIARLARHIVRRARSGSRT